MFQTCSACVGRRRLIFPRVCAVQNRTLRPSSLTTKVCFILFLESLFHADVVAEYDARLVDVWAAAIVFYCMQFQELPWRVAKPSDPTFAQYLAMWHHKTDSGAPSHSTPPPLNNLVPRECRHVIKHMLDPDPKTRWSIDEALKDKWLASVPVCEEGEHANHTHTTAGMEIVKF